ncbi:MAG: methionine synthase [Chloroflexota bacterium]
MTGIEFNCSPTMIGSMPQKDPGEACALVAKYLRDVPAWPQLTRRSYLEDMNVQFSEGFPGVVVGENKIHVDRSQDLTAQMERLYAAYLAGDAGSFPIGADYAAGLHRFLALEDLAPRAVKGQVTGPVTWGLSVTDETGRAIVYDEALGDAVPKFLRLKAAWQERELRKLCPRTIIFVDEPYLSAFGSVTMNLSRQQVIALLEEVFGGITGVRGVHCCGNTDWSILLACRVHVISYDAYNYAASLALYPAEVNRFLEKGGVIAWGIVPNTAEALAKESVASLRDRLGEAMAPFTRNGVRFRDLVAQGLLTPSCGLEGLSPAASETCLELLVKLSEEIKRKYR